MPSSDLGRRRGPLGNEKGIALVIVAVFLVMFVSLVGVAVDMGRGYIVRSALGAAVDGAALAAARAFPQGVGPAQTAANRIFNANFPAGFLGVTSVTNPPSVVFTVAGDGSNVITVSSSATLPTTFIKILGSGFNNLNVGTSGQATRRLVDMAFVIDRSGSLGSAFPAVRTASSNFVGLFDATLDRMALISFATNTIVHSPIVTPGRGFAKATLQTQIGGLASSGNTSTAEGLYQAWNQLKRIPVANQSGLRAIVLFTDGAPNSFSANYVAATGSGVYPNCSNAVPNFPSGTRVDVNTATLTCGDPRPGVNTETQGLWGTYTGTRLNPTNNPVNNTDRWQSPNGTNFTAPNPCIPFIPPTSIHVPQGGAAGGMPTSFPLFDGTVPGQLALINPNGINFPNHVQNANNAARNLAAIVADRIRADTTGAARIHIFALGLGALLTQGTGADGETGTHMLRRIVNDPTSNTYNASQPEGGYFFAGSTSELDAAYHALRDRIIRISQ